MPAGGRSGQGRWIQWAETSQAVLLERTVYRDAALTATDDSTRMTAGKLNLADLAMNDLQRFLAEHRRLARRFFLKAAVAGAAAFGSWPLGSRAAAPSP